MLFQDRQGKNLNRRKIKIINQAANEILADIERADNPTIEGTPINAEILNSMQSEIKSYADGSFINGISYNTNTNKLLATYVDGKETLLQLPSSHEAQKYFCEFHEEDWQDNGNEFTVNILQSEHLKGAYPLIKFEDNQIFGVININGDLTIFSDRRKDIKISII